jgi:hypothetical protein
MPKDSDHDAAGWVNYCPTCGRAYWAAWLPSQHRARRRDFSNREHEHVCTPEEGRL